MLTKEVKLPEYSELEVQEVELSTPFLKAASFHLGKQCEAENNEFMLCRQEERDPRKCLQEGKLVTACSLKFFQAVKKTCAQELTNLGLCLERNSQDMSFEQCRNTQAVFDGCMKEKLGIERPHFGYFCEPKIHNSVRPEPKPAPPPVYEDALVDVPPPDVPRNPSYHQGRPLCY